MSAAYVNHSCNMSKPEIIGYMSVNVSREYSLDLSQLKFLNSIPNGSIYMDLNHRINDAIKRTTDDNDEKISLLLKFIKNNTKYLNLDASDLAFISYRRTLISVMYNTFHNERARIMASMFNGSIYLCSFDTPQELQRRQSRSKQEDRFCAWGYKFEQYLLSDLPDIPPNIERPVIENEEFSLYYQYILGEHKLLYGAQIDGLLANNDKVTCPPDTTDFKRNLDYLKKYDFIELKTNRIIQNHRQEQTLRKFKLLKCWCQCYLANLKGLIIGFRDDKGIITKLQCFKTEDIVAYCKNEWQPHQAIKFLDYFLSFVKTTFKNQIKKSAAKDLNAPISFIFDLHGSNISVSECDDKDYCILPDWFIEGMTNKSQ